MKDRLENLDRMIDWFYNSPLKLYRYYYWSTAWIKIYEEYNSFLTHGNGD